MRLAVAVVLAALAAAVAHVQAAPARHPEAAPPPGPYILSVTASGDFGTPNSMLQFDPENVNHVYNTVAYPHYEDTIGGAYDVKRNRYFLLTEEDEINVYDAGSFKQLKTISTMDISIQYAVGMHYDQPTDHLWVLYTSQETTPTQWCSVNVSNAVYSCNSFGSGMLQAESSAYDAKNHMLYAQLVHLTADEKGAAKQKGGKLQHNKQRREHQRKLRQHTSNDANLLYGFNTQTLEVTGPFNSGELCSNMEVAYVENTTYLLCVRFLTNDVVKIDVSTGRPTTMLVLPPLHDPVANANAVRNVYDQSSASYFLQLQGPTEFHWVEIDVASHKVVSNSSTLIYQHLPLAMTVYVPPRPSDV